jgi:hypothetical protein
LATVENLRKTLQVSVHSTRLVSHGGKVTSLTIRTPGNSVPWADKEIRFLLRDGRLVGIRPRAARIVDQHAKYDNLGTKSRQEYHT